MTPSTSSTSSKIDRLPEITKQDVYALDWSYMFDIQVRARAVKAGLIARLEISGEGNFVLYKQSADTRGRSALIEITQRSTFPSDDYIYHEVKPHWGGGEYVVRHNYLPKQNLYEYNVPGPPLINGRPMASDLPGAPPEARANTPEGQNEALKQSILQNFFEQMNPDDRHAIGRELASKNLGIKLDEPQEPEKPEFLTGMHRFQKGSEISDPRIMRYLPVEATDIRLISDRNGHMAHYRISAEAFDTFLDEVWERYRKERDAKPKSWVNYSEEQITAARKGRQVGRYEPKVRSTEITFDKPIVWELLENATKYDGPRKRSAAGGTYYFDRTTGIACQDAGYW